MKQYQPSGVGPFACLTILCAAMLLTGCALLAAQCPLTELILLLMSFGTLLGIFFLVLLLISCSTCLRMDDEKIIFPVDRASKWLWRRKTVYFQEMDHIVIETIRGAAPVSRDTQFFHFHLKNGEAFMETFYQYGRQQEKEIRSELEKRVRVTAHAGR